MKKNGAVAIRALGNIPEKLALLAHVYNAKSEGYRASFTREQWFMKRLNKIELIRGFYHKDGGLAYLHYDIPQVIGQPLPPNFQEHPGGLTPCPC